jgi:hypothetical protein
MNSRLIYLVVYLVAKPWLRLLRFRVFSSDRRILWFLQNVKLARLSLVFVYLRGLGTGIIYLSSRDKVVWERMVSRHYKSKAKGNCVCLESSLPNI